MADTHPAPLVPPVVIPALAPGQVAAPPPSSSSQLAAAPTASSPSYAEHPPYNIRYASGREDCGGPQPCKGSLIEEGALQFGTWWGDCPWGPRWVWRHWACVTPKVLQNCHDKIGHDVKDLDGFSMLRPLDQMHVRDIFDQGRPNGLTILKVPEIKMLLGVVGLPKKGDRAMLLDRITMFFTQAGLSLEGSQQDLLNRLAGHAQMLLKGMAPAADVAAAPSSSATLETYPQQPGASSYPTYADSNVGVGGSGPKVEDGEKKPAISLSGPFIEAEEQKANIESEEDSEEETQKPAKKRKRAPPQRSVKPRVKKETVKQAVKVVDAAPPPPPQGSRRSIRLKISHLLNDEDADAPGPSVPPSLGLDHPAIPPVKQEIVPKIEEQHQLEGLVFLDPQQPVAKQEEEVDAPIVPKLEEGSVGVLGDDGA